MADMSDRLTIRGIDPAVWRQARLAAVNLDLTMGEAVNEALRRWLAGVEVSVDERKLSVTSVRRPNELREEPKP